MSNEGVNVVSFIGGEEGANDGRISNPGAHAAAGIRVLKSQLDVVVKYGKCVFFTLKRLQIRSQLPGALYNSQ
ncbi:hypothetical protein FF1_025420 [Malus domestica]